MSIDEFLKWSQGITVQYNLPISVDTDHFRALVASLVYYKKIRTPEALQFERGETIELRRLPKYIDFSL